MPHRGALAQAQLRHRQQGASFLRIGHAHDRVPGPEPDAPHAPGPAAHLADLPGFEADGLALLRGQHDLRVLGDQLDADETVRAVQRDGEDAGPLGVDELHQAGALDDAPLRDHEDAARVLE